MRPLEAVRFEKWNINKNMAEYQEANGSFKCKLNRRICKNNKYIFLDIKTLL